MPWYNAQGQQAPDAAWMVINDERVQVQNPAAIVSWREAHGYIYPERPPQPTPEPEPIDTTDFDNACEQFREICYTIGQAIGDPDFKGGFDEMIKLQQAPIYNTIQGLQLANAWSALNDLCTYEGKKIGLGQPEWWHTCWDQVAPTEEPSEPEEQPVEPEQNMEINTEPPVIEDEHEEPDYSDTDAPTGELPEEPVTNSQDETSGPAEVEDPTEQPTTPEWVSEFDGLYDPAAPITEDEITQEEPQEQLDAVPVIETEDEAVPEQHEDVVEPVDPPEPITSETIPDTPVVSAGTEEQGESVPMPEPVTVVVEEPATQEEPELIIPEELEPEPEEPVESSTSQPED